MTLLDARDLAVTYQGSGRQVRALKGVSAAVAPGEIVGIVGESGSGKSTLVRALVGLEQVDAGQIKLSGRTVATAGVRRPPDLAFARAVQFVFQDAAGALNPRMLNWRTATEPAALLNGVTGRALRRELAERLFDQVSLPSATLDNYPHALSGGQRQRLALCRALSVSPRLMILDEPTSALDVSVQARILDQLLVLNQGGMAMLIISHDVAVIRHLCTRILVMREGAVVENAPRETLFAAPSHPYTRDLLAAAGFAAPEIALHTPRYS